MKDVPTEESALQPLLQHVRREQVGNFFQIITGAWMAFRADAQFTQPLYPAPDRGPRNANLACDACAADDNGGVFREQRD